MACEGFRVDYRGGLAVATAAFLVRKIDSPALLRGSRMQSKYEAHCATGGNGIKEGWQVNIFPYLTVLVLLDMLTGDNWLHYVWADKNGVNLEKMREQAEKQKVERWVVFVNPAERQSQTHIPHGQALLPKGILS